MTTMTNQFEMQSQSAETEAPAWALITRWQDMVGKTVRSVVEFSGGAHGACTVIVFEDLSFAGLVNEGGEEDGVVDLCRWYRSTKPTILDFISPDEALDIGLINHGQFERLRAKEQEAQQKATQEEIRLLQIKLEQLKGKADSMSVLKRAHAQVCLDAIESQADQGGSNG
jgi:hypothetical protein